MTIIRDLIHSGGGQIIQKPMHLTWQFLYHRMELDLQTYMAVATSLQTSLIQSLQLMEDILDMAPWMVLVVFMNRGKQEK